MATFAEYILNENDFIKKIDIMSYLKKKNKIYFNVSVIMKTEILREFIKVMKIDVDENLVVTASLLYDCLKVESPEEINKIKNMDGEYRKYLKSLGFNDKFCNICIGHCREYKLQKREKESDLLELIDQFGAMLLHRSDRLAYSVEEAMDLLKNKNLYKVDNQYLDKFEEFVDIMEEIEILQLGLLTRFQKDMNCVKRDDIPGAVRELYNTFERNEKCFAKKEAELRMGGDLFEELRKARAKLKLLEKAPLLPGFTEDDID
ncbi:MAG: hypothetical protein IKF52_05040 [Clostridia bacterium]|nr:hypothetical protein [Clostridia bacterium]